jgi:hypothetical protein
MLHNLSTSPSPKQRQKYGDALTTASDSAGGIPTGIDIQHWDDLTALAESFEDRALRLLVREYMSV